MINETTKNESYNNKDIWQPAVFTLIFGLLVFIGGVSPIPFGISQAIKHELFIPFVFISMAFLNQKQVRWYFRLPAAIAASVPFLLGLIFYFQPDNVEYSRHGYSIGKHTL